MSLYPLNPIKHHRAIDQALLVSVGMTTDEAELWLRKTHLLQASCGCKAGAASMLTAIVLGPLVWQWTLRESFWPLWQLILIWLIGVFVAGVVGKVFGLIIARMRIRLRLRAIQSKLKEKTQHV